MHAGQGAYYIRAMTDRNQLWLILIIEFACLGAISMLGDLRTHVFEFLLLFGAASAAFLFALHRLRTTPLGLLALMSFALLLRLPALTTVPSLSDDVWRYLHDGRAQLAGINPYLHPPANSATASVRKSDFARINHPELPTIYPPFAQLTFALSAALGASLWSWKLILLLFDLGTAALLFLYCRQVRAPVLGAALYAWHPLIIVEFAGSAHMDPVAFTPLVAALLLLALGQRLPAGLALGAAIAGKLLPAAYLPLLFRRNRGGFLTAAALTVFTLYLLYGLAQGLPVAGSLSTFAENWRSNASLYLLLERLVPGHVARGIALALALVTIGWLAWRRTPETHALLSATLALLLLSPVVHPWYVAWLVPLLVIRHAAATTLMVRPDYVARAALAWSFTCVAVYTVLPVYARTGSWNVPSWALWLEYLPVFALLSAGWIRARVSW